MRDTIVRLERKPDNDLAFSLLRAQPCEHIGIRCERQRQRTGPALELLRRHPGNAIIADRSGHDDHVGLRRRALRSGLQLERGVDARHRDTVRRLDAGVPGEQRHVGAAIARSGRDRKAHTPTRTVGQHTHGIDRLLGTARGDQHAQAFHAAAARNGTLDRVHDIGDLGEPPRTCESRGERTRCRSDQFDTPRQQRANIGLCRLGAPHLQVHRRRHQQRRARREHHCRQRIRRFAVHHARHQVSRRRRDHERIGRLGHVDMLHVPADLCP